MEKMKTSFSNESISLRIDFMSVVIENLPSNFLFDEFMIYLLDEKNVEHAREICKKCLPFEYKLPNLIDGIYYLNIYYKSNRLNCYNGYLSGKDIPIQIYHGVISFIDSLVFRENRICFSSLKSNQLALNNLLEPSFCIQSDDIQLINLSKKITKYSHTDYHMVLSIHHWVAMNIYYDMDVLNSGSYQRIDASALGTLASGKSICQGYSDLSIALLRASGIPAMGMSCFALGLSTTGGWERPENRTAKANHQITLAYADNRWIIMDITWDSDNEFIHGKYQKKTGMGISHKYFDNTLAFISNTHRFIL